MTETFHAGPNLGRLSDVTIIHGDCIEAMAELAADSVDAIVTDPPYGLGFMGKAWDELPPGLDWAKQCLRVLKPGGHLLAFGGTRTWHRLAVAVEDAGFEIRDSIAWLYGSGFPKSLDVSKAIDKAAGATREVVSTGATVKRMIPGADQDKTGSWIKDNGRTFTETVTAPATPEAERWSGWGTALKPAFEPLIVARKPFRGTVAANVLAHGTGALNIDACRLDTVSAGPGTTPKSSVNGQRGSMAGPMDREAYDGSRGRWPANVVLDADQAAALDEQSGFMPGGNRPARRGADANRTAHGAFDGHEVPGGAMKLDGGGASRFFYVAKAPKKERPVAYSTRISCTLCGKEEIGFSSCSCPFPDFQPEPTKVVAHPTVKPLALMRWLVRLVTPPGGVVLDPFAGSGTTVEAALLEDFRVIGIEREADYLPMIQQRIARCLNS